MKSLLTWASWLVAVVSTYLITMGCLGYLLGNIQIFNVRYTTYLSFGGYFVLLAIMVILLKISYQKK
ncbi:MAG: hypothetical protein Q8M08_08000 [Bacteroidales bacterium]|nr:hypothetical protein [Bacteroidales bacterium]